MSARDASGWRKLLGSSIAITARSASGFFRTYKIESTWPIPVLHSQAQ